MNPRFIQYLLRVLLASLLWVSPLAHAAEKPNILIILADDLGYSDLGCYGSEIATPNLDNLAKNGLRFTQFYNTARCWPTRAALMTGYYPQQVRMDPPQGRVPDWTRALPQLLKPLGYRSYHSGKWHIAGLPRTCADAGFDHSYRLDDHDHNFNPQNLLEDDRKLPPVRPNSGYYTATAFADHAIRCLKEHAEKYAGQPFFSYLAFTTPHFPLQAPPEDIAKYRDKYLAGWETVRAERYRREKELGIVDCALSAPEPQIRAPSGKPGVETNIGPGEVAYALPWASLTADQKRFQATKMAIHAAMVDRIDQEVGRVLAQVKAMGALDNTLVVFLSDNGASAEMLIRGDGHDPTAPPGSAASFLCLGPGWSTMSNTPFRRHKIWVHEGGISTPLIVHWPKGFAARGELRHDVGHVIDLMPTVLELAGVGAEGRPPGAPPLPGRSLVPAFAKDGAVKRDWVFWHHQGNRALRVGDWKIVSARDDDDTWRLYDLATDRAESTDLAVKQPERVREMSARWQQLEDEFRREAGVAEGSNSGKAKGNRTSNIQR
jgi:arylsulfatase